MRHKYPITVNKTYHSEYFSSNANRNVLYTVSAAFLDGTVPPIPLSVPKLDYFSGHLQKPRHNI